MSATAALYPYTKRQFCFTNRVCCCGQPRAPRCAQARFSIQETQRKCETTLETFNLDKPRAAVSYSTYYPPFISRYNGNAVPFSRRATSMLTSGLQATREVIDGINRSDDDWAIDEVIKKGVSANMCGAVEKMLGDERNQCELELSVRWALTRKPPAEMPSPVRFCNSDVPFLINISPFLKRLPARSSEL